MKKIILTLLLGIGMFPESGLAQSERDLINKQIWIPFTSAWEANDGKAFNQLHTDDLVRITPKELIRADEYKRRNMRLMNGERKRNSRIEFAFDYRQVNGDIAYEMGFYRIVSPDNKQDPYVARFHVELRKVDGIWKIARDYDANKIGNQRVSPKMYAALDFRHYVAENNR